MKSFFIVSLKFGACVLGVVAFFAIVQTSTTYAGASDRMSGYAWSSNTGWINTNSCDDLGKVSTCTTPIYGVTMAATGTTRAITGYAWSSNLGWISFDKTASDEEGNLFQRCPTKTAKGDCQAYADWTNPTAVTLKGWARVCSVFVSGCTGNLKNQTILGGWDGFISLSGTNYGVTIDAVTGTMSGYAWGGDVIGWVDFSGANMTIPTAPECSDGKDNDGDGKIDALDPDCWTIPGVPSSYDPNHDSEAPSIPVITLTAIPTVGDVNSVNPDLVWTTTNAPKTCSAEGDWKGAKSTAGGGPESQGILTKTGKYTYILKCTYLDAVGTTATATATATVDVVPVGKVVCPNGTIVSNIAECPVVPSLCPDGSPVPSGGRDYCSGGSKNACSNIPGVKSPVVPPYKAFQGGTCGCAQPGYVLNVKTYTCTKPVYQEPTI